MVTGKNSLSFKKENVKEQKSPSVGVKTVAFAHQAQSAGENAILFDSLVQPQAWAESGFSNPNGSKLLDLQLQVFADNITVTSSLRGLIQKEEYVVKNGGIFFKNFTTEVNEVFEVYVADLLVSGNRLVDMKIIRVEGELADAETEFLVGNQLDVFEEEVIVFRDGIQMFRADNNDSSGATGNYYYLDNDGDGKSSVIKFFEPAEGPEPILIASTGGRVDSPNVSTFQEIETLAGQLDAIIPTVADLAGVSESTFRSSPNNVDLRNFGSRLVTAENDIDSLEQGDPYPAFRATSNNGQTLNTTFSTYAYEDVEGDTDNAYDPSTGIYTIPTGKAGWYSISASIRTDTATWSSGNSINLGIVVNDAGPAKSLNNLLITASVTGKLSLQVSDAAIFLNEGDNVRIKAQTSITTTTETSPRSNYFSLVRVR